MKKCVDLKNKMMSKMLLLFILAWTLCAHLLWVRRSAQVIIFFTWEYKCIILHTMKNTESSHRCKMREVKTNGGEKLRTIQKTQVILRLSRFCIYKLHLDICRHVATVAALWLHLILDRTHWIHSAKYIPWSYMCSMNKVRGFSYHGSVDTPPPLRLRLFCNAAVETQPEFTHC